VIIDHRIGKLQGMRAAGVTGDVENAAVVDMVETVAEVVVELAVADEEDSCRMYLRRVSIHLGWGC